ncbi:hypothetical protein AB0J80_15505 [Actinoplanes sp. NPDC049548]|uniref:ATP-grasp domain-containing protein n=1 Tax=Actinoplanes sp. NPDC049548 TaxID=3155152 RepID=UPI00341DB1D5
MTALPRVGVLHAPFGAGNLRDIWVQARGVCQAVMLFREDIAGAHPDIVDMARALFETEVVGDDLTRTVADRGLAGLTTFHDSQLDFVDEALCDLALPGAPGTVAPWDKLVQRRQFAERGLSAIRAAAVDSPRDLAAAVEVVGFPGVLKPRRAARGTGIAFLAGPDDVAYQTEHRDGWEGLVYEGEIPSGEHPSGVSWLADFVSVETVSVGREHRHVALFDKAPMSIVPRTGPDGADSVNTTGDITPSRLPAADLDAVLRLVSDALDALGVNSRVTHTELRVTGAGADIIEINGRAGGHMTQVLRLLDGPNLIRPALHVALGLDPGVPPPMRPGYAAGLFVPFPERHGVVRSDVRPAELRALPGVVGVDEVAEVGDERSETGFRVATVTLRAQDADVFDRQVLATVEGIARLFEADGLLDDPWLRRVLSSSPV